MEDTRVEVCHSVTSGYHSPQLLVHIALPNVITSMWRLKNVRTFFHFRFEDVTIFAIRVDFNVFYLTTLDGFPSTFGEDAYRGSFWQVQVSAFT